MRGVGCNALAIFLLASPAAAGASSPNLAPAAEGAAVAAVIALLLGVVLAWRVLRRHARTFVAPYRLAAADPVPTDPPRSDP